MSFYDQDRRRPEKRQAVSDFKIVNAAVRVFSGVSANNPVSIETTSFSNAESEDGYISTRNVSIQPIQQQQQQLYVGFQPQPRGEMMQRSQGMSERDHMNQNVPRYPTGYSSCPPGMHPIHPTSHYGQPTGVCMMNQPTQQTMHNMTLQREQQQHQYPQQTYRWQPQPGSEMIQRPQGMMGKNLINQNVPRNPAGYSSCPPGMCLMHLPVHYEEPTMMNQPTTTQPIMHNMAQQQEHQQCQQTDRWQPQPGGETIQRPQGMMGKNLINQNVPGDPAGYSSCPPGMCLMHPPVHYEEPTIMNQPTTQPIMHNMAQQQEHQQCQQTDRWQPQPGGEVIQRPQEMIEWDHMNRGLVRGVHPMQPQAQYRPHSGMGMPRMINQPTPQPTVYNMAQSGDSMNQRHPRMGSYPEMVRPPMNSSPFMTWEISSSRPSRINDNMAMQHNGEHCQMTTLPSTNVVTSLYHFPNLLPVVSHSLSGSPSIPFYEMLQRPQRTISGPQSIPVSHLVTQDKSKITPRKRNLHSQCDEPSKRSNNLLPPTSLASLMNSETVIVSPNDPSGFAHDTNLDQPLSSEYQCIVYERNITSEEKQKNGRKSPKQQKAKEPPDMMQCKFVTSSAFENVTSVVISPDHVTPGYNAMTTQESLARLGHLCFKDQSNKITCHSNNDGNSINQQSWMKGWADGWADGWIKGWMDASKGLPRNPEIPFNYKNLPPKLTRASSPNNQLTTVFSQKILTQSVQEGYVTGTYQSISKIFHTHSADLCDAIEAEPLRIINKLISSQLIDPSIRNDVTNMHGTAYEKANKIVLSIEKRLRGSIDPVKYLQNLCDFLQNKVEDGILNNIGAKMRSDLQYIH